MENASTPVVLLAGGSGSRLWPISDLMPKALIPVAGKPCIKWIIDELREQGFRNLTVCVNKGQEQEFIYALDDVAFNPQPAETSICQRILALRTELEAHSSFLVVYADDLTHTNYGRLISCLESADVALATTSTVPLEFGLISSDDNGTIVEFDEKPNLAKFMDCSIWTGRAAMKTRLLHVLEGREDLARDVFPFMLKTGRTLTAVNGNESWYDVGSIAHWRKANEEYAKTVIA